jgi:hypothetical protein
MQGFFVPGARKTAFRATLLRPNVARPECCDFSCFCVCTPFDVTCRSGGKGRFRARRRIGHSGEQIGQSVLPVALGCGLL